MSTHKKINRNDHAKTTARTRAQPLAEGIRKRGVKPYTHQDIGLIRSRRRELSLLGLNDSAVAKKLAKELSRAAAAIKEKIRRLVKSGDFEETPNKQLIFTAEETHRLKTQRAELIHQGLTDWRIANELAIELRRPVHSIVAKLIRLIASGQLEENPNKHLVFTPEETARIKARRAKMIKRGLTDRAIARRLSKELKRSVNSIFTKIRKLVTSKELEENPNRRLNLTYFEIERIILRRRELIERGLVDEVIAKRMGKELNRSAGVVRNRIQRLIRSGQLEENQNRIIDFSDAELEQIRSRRNELIEGGLADGAIAGILARELGSRKRMAFYNKIRTLVKLGQLPENPHKRISAIRKLARIIEKEPGVQTLLNLGLQANRRYLPEVVERLLVIFPGIRLAAGEISRQILEDAKLGEFLGRTKSRERGIKPVFDLLVDENLIRILEKDAQLPDIVFKIARDSLGPEFNRNARGTVRRLQIRARQERNRVVKEIIRMVAEHYREILGYDIPGVGRLGRNA